MAQELEYVNCNLCGSNLTKIVAEVGPFKLVKCRTCGLVYDNPRLSVEDTQHHYIRLYNDSFTHKTRWFESRIDMFSECLKKLESFRENGRLLDVGCGRGYFLRLARDRGWNTYGVEISEDSSDFARKEYNLDVCRGTVRQAKFRSEYFDVITLWNVLDHFWDPISELAEINRVLRRGGLIFIRVPNISFHLKVYFLLRLLGQFGEKLQLERRVATFRLYCFSARTLKKTLSKVGFVRVNVANSLLTSGDPFSTMKPLGYREVELIKRSLYMAVQVLYRLSKGAIVLGPNMQASAIKD